MINLIVYLVIIGAIAWLAIWILQQLPPPEPLSRILRVAVIVIAVIAVILAISRAFNIAI